MSCSSSPDVGVRRQVGEAHLEQPRLGLAEQLRERVVHPGEPAVEVGEDDAERRRRERVAEAALGLARGGVGASALAHVAGVHDHGFHAELGRQLAAGCLEPDPRSVVAPLPVLERARVEPVVELGAETLDERVDVVGVDVVDTRCPDQLVGAEAEEAFAVR